MRRFAVFPLALLLAVMLTSTGLAQLPAQSSPLTALDMERIVGSGGCGVAQGFMAGAALGAAVAVLVPGAQSAAAILGLTAAAFKVMTVTMC